MILFVWSFSHPFAYVIVVFIFTGPSGQQQRTYSQASLATQREDSSRRLRETSLRVQTHVQSTDCSQTMNIEL